MQTTFPAAVPVIEKIPSTAPLPGQATPPSKTDRVVDSKQPSSSLPAEYDAVPNLLRNIEQSKAAVANADSGMNPTDQRSVPNFSEAIPVEKSTPNEEKQIDDVPPLVQPTAEPTEVEVTKSPVQVVDTEKEPPMTSEPSFPMDSSDTDETSSRHTSVPSGQGKLARLLGKGDYRAEEVEGRDVVDNSVYQKPNRKHAANVTQPEVVPPSTFTPVVKPASLPVKQPEKTGATSEVLALRSELESMTKWEAVRLQEAVRAQIVEDSKKAAKQAAVVAKQHEEEMVRVREEAVTNANKILNERTAAMKRRLVAERDEELAKLLKEGEEALRQSVATEYADRERGQTVEREKVLLEAKAQVASLSELFESLANQTERAKAATKRSCAAFMLRQSVFSCGPIGKHLEEAAGSSELGVLVAASVPESSVRKGVESLDDLRKRFQSASQRGLSVAMVPENYVGTIWGQLLGAVFSRLKIAVEDVDGSDTGNEARIRRARCLVRDGDLVGAIISLDGLNGLSKDVMQDWLDAAKARVASELAADVLLADAIISQALLSGASQ